MFFYPQREAKSYKQIVDFLKSNEMLDSFRAIRQLFDVKNKQLR